MNVERHPTVTPSNEGSTCETTLALPVRGDVHLGGAPTDGSVGPPRRFTVFVCPVCGWGSKFPDHVKGTSDMCVGGPSNSHALTQMQRIEVVEVGKSSSSG